MGSRGLVAGAAFAAVGLFIASVRRVSTVSVPVASKLAGKVAVFLLDGGTGEELIRQGVPDDRDIWSAVAVVKPQWHDKLIQVHRSFIRAGSTLVTTNNYGITPGVGFSEEDMVKYTREAGRLAQTARAMENAESRVRICGSLPPLLESYRPDKVMPHVEGVATYSKVVEALAPFVDLYLAETLSSIEEMTQAVGAAVVEGKPVLASWSLRSDGKLRSGEGVTEAVLALLALPHGHLIEGVLFNCAEPEAIRTALEELNEAGNPALLLLHAQGGKLGAYANRLVPVAPDWVMGGEASTSMREDLGVGAYHATVLHWVQELNVRLVGGCCGIGPEYIKHIHDDFERRRYLAN